jgi:hypothetical protein
MTTGCGIRLSRTSERDEYCVGADEPDLRPLILAQPFPVSFSVAGAAAVRRRTGRGLPPFRFAAGAGLPFSHGARRVGR